MSQFFSVSCTMPSLEVGTVGGGTVLGPQSACLKVMLLCILNVQCSSTLGSKGILDFWLGANKQGAILA